LKLRENEEMNREITRLSLSLKYIEIYERIVEVRKGRNEGMGRKLETVLYEDLFTSDCK
jgi:hypothetical protein